VEVVEWEWVEMGISRVMSMARLCNLQSWVVVNGVVLYV